MEVYSYGPNNWEKQRKRIAAFVKEERFTIYIGNLNVALHWEDVFATFRQYGTITDFFYPCKSSGLGLGYAVIAYKKKFSAFKVAGNYNGRTYHNQRLYVASTIRTRYMTTKDATLYVSNISDFINEDIMLDFFSTRGSVKRVQIKWNVFGYRYAIVTFYSQYCAKLTLKECCGTHLGDGYHWNITDEYYPYNDGPLTPINYRNLHCMRQKEGYVRISGLTSTVTESELNALFRNVGCYTRTILLRYGGNPSGYAIARFPTERAALLGIRRFNNFSRNGMTMKLEYVRVNWAPTHCPDVKWNAIPKVRSKK